MTLTDAELHLLARVKAADGRRVDLTDVNAEEREAAKRLVYLGYLDHVPGHLVLTPAGAQALKPPAPVTVRWPPGRGGQAARRIAAEGDNKAKGPPHGQAARHQGHPHRRDP